MIIEWMAHSCFRIETQEKTLLFDPFDAGIGYSLPDICADVCFVSHEHYDHNNTGAISGECEIINKPGKYQFGDIVATGYEAHHDEANGELRGKVVMFKIESENIALLHCGDIGRMLTEEEVAGIGHVDILMIPVGGKYTVDTATAVELCRTLKPNIVIPMHYKTAELQLDIVPVEIFLKAIATYFDRSTLRAGSFEIMANKLKKRPRVVVMDNNVKG